MNQENQVNSYNVVHTTCLSDNQLVTFGAMSAIMYLTVLLVVAFLCVKLVNWSELVKYKYDLSKTLYVAIVLLVTINVLFMLLNIKILYSMDVFIALLVTMVLMAYNKF